jgi:hypothetical protein
MRIKRWTGLVLCLLLGTGSLVTPSPAADEPGMVVGRVSYIEGDLLRYIPTEKDWVAVVRDAPFGPEDTLFSGNDGLAELIVPNGTWVRTGNSTQIQFIALEPDLAEMDLASGVARFYNKSSGTVIQVTSPFGYVLAYSGAVFDFYVGDTSVEVVAVKGRVSFVHSATEAIYDVAAGSSSILADRQQVSSAEGTVDPDWNRWNTAREKFWAAKARVRGRSVEYLPPSLQDEAYALEENGRWEQVPYEGTERWFWRPRVVFGWSPFTVGRWTDWYGDQTWIPAEPFGYVTHHYGNWIYLRNYWYWAPPVASVRVGLPFLDVGYYWYPGRVSWIHRGAYVGWVPLAPRETYYSHRHWGGPYAKAVNNLNIQQFNSNVRNYAYANQAVLVNQDNFYRVNNYRDVRVTHVDRAAIINDYRAAPVVNNTVIKNYATDRKRYNYTNAQVSEKPHNTVISRIRQNEAIIQEGRREKASVLRERVKSIPEGKVNREARIEAPRVTNYIVPVGEVNRPKSEMGLPQKEIKSRGAGPAGARPGVADKPEPQPGQSQAPERLSPARPASPRQPTDRSERAAPPRPSPPERSAPTPKPERVSPLKPAPPEQPMARPERAAPPRPGQPERPAPPPKPERVSPPKPAPPEQPAARPERAAPPRPGQPERPAPPPKPERVSPPKPAPPDQPAARPERAAPPRPGQPERPAPPPKPERVSPPKPAPPEQPAARPQQVAPSRPSPPQQPGQPQETDRTKKQRPPKEEPEDQPGQEKKPR